MQKTRGLYLLPNVSGIYFRKKCLQKQANMYSVGIQVSNSMLILIADRTQASSVSQQMRVVRRCMHLHRGTSKAEQTTPQLLFFFHLLYFYIFNYF